IPSCGFCSGLRMTPTRVTCGATSLSSSSDFPYLSNSPGAKPVMLPPGRARLATKPLPTGSVIWAKMIGRLRVSCCSGCNASAVLTRITSGSRPHQLFRVGTDARRVGAAPAIVDADVAAVAPAEFFKRLPERRQVRPRFRIILDERVEHADP